MSVFVCVCMRVHVCYITLHSAVYLAYTCICIWQSDNIAVIVVGMDKTCRMAV